MNDAFWRQRGTRLQNVQFVFRASLSLELSLWLFLDLTNWPAQSSGPRTKGLHHSSHILPVLSEHSLGDILAFFPLHAVIRAGTKAAEGVSAADMAKRERVSG